MPARICNDECPTANQNEHLLCFKCENIIHLKCYGIDKKQGKLITDSPNIILMCDICLEELVTLAEISKGIAEVKKVVEKIAKVVSKENKTTSKPILNNNNISGDNTPIVTRSVKRKRLDQQSTIRTPINKVIGTNDAAELKSVEGRRQLVVTQIHPETTEEMVIQYIRKQLQLNDTIDIRAKTLLPKDRNKEDLSYISVKIVVPESLYSLVLSAELWPKGIAVRDFVPGFKRRQPMGVTLNDQ